MAATRITQILNNASTLQAAGRTDREDALHITRAAFALGAEAALTPQYSLTYNTLGNIVSRPYTLILYKRPQMLTMFDNPATFAGQFAPPGSSFFEKLFHAIHQWLHSVLKSPPLQCSITNTLAHPQYLLRQTAKLLAYLAHRTFDLADRLEIPFQMRPAYLANTGKEIISAPAVTDQGAAERAQQLSGRFLSSPGMNHKNRCTSTTQSPQPASLSISSSPAPCAYWC